MASTIDFRDRAWHERAHVVITAPLDELKAPAWAEQALIGAVHNDSFPWTAINQVHPHARSNAHPGIAVATSVIGAVEAVSTVDLDVGHVSRGRAVLLGAATVGRLASGVKDRITTIGPVEQDVANRLDALTISTSGYIGHELVERVLTRDIREEYLRYLAAGLFDAQSDVDLNGLSLAEGWLANKYPQVQEFLGKQSIEGVLGTLNGIIPGDEVMDLRSIAEVELKVTPRMFSNLLRLRGLDTIQDIRLQAKTIEGRKSFALRRLSMPELLSATRSQLIGFHDAATAQLAINLAERKARTTGFSRDRIEPGRGSDPRLTALHFGVEFAAAIANVSGSRIVDQRSEHARALLDRIMFNLIKK